MMNVYDINIVFIKIRGKKYKDFVYGTRGSDWNFPST